MIFTIPPRFREICHSTAAAAAFVSYLSRVLSLSFRQKCISVSKFSPALSLTEKLRSLKCCVCGKLHRKITTFLTLSQLVHPVVMVFLDAVRAKSFQKFSSARAEQTWLVLRCRRGRGFCPEVSLGRRGVRPPPGKRTPPHHCLRASVICGVEGHTTAVVGFRHGFWSAKFSISRVSE